MITLNAMITTAEITASIQQGNTDLLSEALQADPAIAATDASEGVSLLLFAAYCNNQQAVNLLKQYRTSFPFMKPSVRGRWRSSRNCWTNGPKS